MSLLEQLMNEIFDVPDIIPDDNKSYRQGWNDAMKRAEQLLSASPDAEYALKVALDNIEQLRTTIAAMLKAFPHIGAEYSTSDQQRALAAARALIG